MAPYISKPRGATLSAAPVGEMRPILSTDGRNFMTLGASDPRRTINPSSPAAPSGPAPRPIVDRRCGLPMRWRNKVGSGETGEKCYRLPDHRGPHRSESAMARDREERRTGRAPGSGVHVDARGFGHSPWRRTVSVSSTPAIDVTTEG